MMLSLPETTADGIRQLHEENAVLKAMLSEFKDQLKADIGEDPETEVSPGRAPFTPEFAKQGSSTLHPPRDSISSISHPAILWRELVLERKRSVMYRREAESLRAVVDKLKAGDVIDKLTHKLGQLQQQVDELNLENIALSKIQKNQEKQLMSEEVLEQEWPVRLAILQQDLDVAQDRGVRSQTLANELRKKGIDMSNRLESLKVENGRLVKEVSDVKSRAGNGGGSDTFASLRAEIKDLRSQLEASVSAQAKLRTFAQSLKAQTDRNVAKERSELKKSKDEVADVRRQLKEARDDARRNVLNMKELKRTLGGLAVGNMKVKEIKGLLPASAEVETLDLRSLESVLPEEIDVERTRFMSPRPPTSEVKQQLRYEEGRNRGGRKARNIAATLS